MSSSQPKPRTRSPQLCLHRERRRRGRGLRPAAIDSLINIKRAPSQLLSLSSRTKAGFGTSAGWPSPLAAVVSVLFGAGHLAAPVTVTPLAGRNGYCCAPAHLRRVHVRHMRWPFGTGGARVGNKARRKETHGAGSRITSSSFIVSTCVTPLSPHAPMSPMSFDLPNRAVPGSGRGRCSLGLILHQPTTAAARTQITTSPFS